MKSVFQFVKKQFWTLALLTGVVLGVRWVVVTKRGPGSMTVVEAQAMDMTAMRAPIGTFAVETDHALEREVGGTESFPANVVAYNDEDVVARVAGLVKDVYVYPGDRVVAGQLLASLQADEVAEMALKDSLEAQAMQSSARGTEQMVNQARSANKRSEFELSATLATEESAQAEVQAMEASVSSASEAVNEAKAMLKEAEASLAYSKVNYDRKVALFEKGAIARNDLDMARRDIDEATAKVGQSSAKVQMSQTELTAMHAKLRAAKSMEKQAAAEVDAARAMVGESRAELARAEEEATAMKSQSESASAGARSSRAMASYTELRALSNGVVTERLVSPGTPVMMGETVLKVKSDGTLRIQADLPQRLSNMVTVGSNVRITIGDETFEEKVTSVFPFVDAMTRSFRIEALLVNKGNRVTSGAFAVMEVVTSPISRSLAVRRSAVKTASDGTHYVWAVAHKESKADQDAEYTCTMHPQIRQKGPGLCPICKMDLSPVDATGSMFVERRNVKVGASDSLYTAILDGLNEGDEVTYVGDKELFPGAAVSVMGEPEPEMTTEKHLAPTKKPEPEPMPVEKNAKRSTMEGHESHVHGAQDRYTCPMHPDVHKPAPGACPICKMDLVPIEDK